MLLKPGMTGPEVANLQRVLIALGLDDQSGTKDFEPDGEYGPKTEAVVKWFQRAHNLQADGWAGEATLSLLDKRYQPETQNFSSSNHISAVSAPLVADEKNIPAILNGVHPILARKALQMVEFAKTEGYTIRISQGLRTFEEQDRLFAKRPKVTNARGGQSYHNYGIAVDFVFYVNGKVSWDEKLYRNLGRWAGRVGLEWGGNWRFVDLPHCQLANMTSIKKLRAVYDKAGGGTKGIKAVWDAFAPYVIERPMPTVATKPAIPILSDTNAETTGAQTRLAETFRKDEGGSATHKNPNDLFVETEVNVNREKVSASQLSNSPAAPAKSSGLSILTAIGLFVSAAISAGANFITANWEWLLFAAFLVVCLVTVVAFSRHNATKRSIGK